MIGVMLPGREQTPRTATSWRAVSERVAPHASSSLRKRSQRCHAGRSPQRRRSIRGALHRGLSLRPGRRWRAPAIRSTISPPFTGLGPVRSGCGRSATGRRWHGPRPAAQACRARAPTRRTVPPSRIAWFASARACFLAEARASRSARARAASASRARRARAARSALMARLAVCRRKPMSERHVVWIRRCLAAV